MVMSFAHIVLLCIICIRLFVTLQAIDNPEEFVNLLAGTFTDGQQFSTGNTLPLIGMPWGFNHWSPQVFLRYISMVSMI